MSWSVTVRVEPGVRVQAPRGVSVRASGAGVSVTVPRQGPAGPEGPQGEEGPPGPVPTLIDGGHF